MDHARIDAAERTEQSPRGLKLARGLNLGRNLDAWLLDLTLRRIGSAPVRLALASGAHASPPNVVPKFTVRMRDLRTLAALMLDPEIAFGDAWSEGRIQVAGDLVEFLQTAYRSLPEAAGASTLLSRLISRVMDMWQANTPAGSLRNIHAHYDLGNEFFRLWLDRELVYTCAYFPSPSLTLEAAQTAKMDYVCRKLRLQPGEKVTEVGCGWGALALYMAREYGVRVKAFNISHEQIQHAKERARAEHLDHLVEFIEDDYRNASVKADAFVSVGMLEHVGRSHYAELGRVIRNVIGDHGRGLLHFIGRSKPAEFSRWIRKRIFPGAHAPSLREALQVLEPFDYAIRDVEDLRVHYAATLEHWLARFDRSAKTISAMYNENFERAWRLYLAGSIAAFRTGALQLFQIVFAGQSCNGLPSTRAHLYTENVAAQ